MKFWLGSPDEIKVNFQCSKCSHAHFAHLKTMVIDNKSRGEAKAILEGRKYFKTKCSTCGCEQLLIHPFFYIENSAKINGIDYGQWAIQFVNTKEEALAFARHMDQLRKMPEHKDDWTTYRVRVCWEFNDFIEKLLIVIALADDRVIEQLKRYGKEVLQRQAGKRIVHSEFLTFEGAMAIRFEFDDKEDYFFEIGQGDYQNALNVLTKTAIMNNDHDLIVSQEMFDYNDLSKKNYKPVHLR